MQCKRQPKGKYVCNVEGNPKGFGLCSVKGNPKGFGLCSVKGNPKGNGPCCDYKVLHLILIKEKLVKNSIQYH